MITIAVPIVLYVTIAVVIETLVEFLVAPVLDRVGRSWLLPYAACLFGIVFSFAYRLDILRALLGIVPVHPIIGHLVTGLALGRGSNFIHDLFGRITGETKRVTRRVSRFARRLAAQVQKEPTQNSIRTEEGLTDVPSTRPCEGDR